MSKILDQVHEKSVEKKYSGKRTAIKCTYTHACTDCTSMFYVKGAKRWCYEERFDIDRVEGQMRYKKSGVTHIVATGVIEHSTLANGYRPFEGNLSRVSYEVNHHLNALEHTCISLGIDFDLFFKKFSLAVKREEKRISENTEKRLY